MQHLNFNFDLHSAEMKNKLIINNKQTNIVSLLFIILEKNSYLNKFWE